MPPNGTSKASSSSPGGPSPTPAGTSERPRLTTQQKRDNHVASEKRRREAVRKGYDILSTIVPGMEGLGRSEALMLSATIKTLREQIKKRMDIIEAMKAAGEDTAHLHLPQDIIQTILQMEREDPLPVENGGDAEA